MGDKNVSVEKKILSFDVGIKNLAYCILHKKDDHVKVLDWNIINLVDDRDLCQFELRNKKICGKIARFISPHNNQKYTTCKAHSLKYVPEINKLEESNSFKCNHLKCKNPACVMVANKEDLAFCDKHEKDTKKIISQFKPKKLLGQNCSQQPIQELSTKLFSKLDANKEFLNVEEVLIENQPSLKNPNMKTIATLLYSYFIFRGIIDRPITKSPLIYVKFISPSNKLKVNKKITDERLNEAKDKKEEYDITKGLGLIYCQTLINDDEKKYLDTHSKKDDLCDAYLQGFRYLYIDGLPECYSTKLTTINNNDLTVTKIKKVKNKKNNQN